MSLTQQLNDLLYKAFTVDGNGKIALRMTLQTGNTQYWKDSVASLANLPSSGNTTGDIRMLMDTGDIYRWNGTAWVISSAVSAGTGLALTSKILSIDLDGNSGLQFIAGKLAIKPDGTTTEVNAGSLRVMPGVYASSVHTHISSDITDWTTALNTWLATKTTANLTENTNLYFTQARVLATPLTGLSIATGTAIVATDTELVAFGKLQKQITDEITNRSNADATKENTITAGTTAQYWRGDKSWQTLNTTAVAEGTNLYFTDPRSIASPLTGLSTATSTAVASTDSILVGIGKLQAQVTLRALDSGVVHIAGTETITGSKTFSSNILATGDTYSVFSSISGTSKYGFYSSHSSAGNAWHFGEYGADGSFRIATEFGGGPTDVFTILNSGVVGLGITNPAERLELSGRMVVRNAYNGNKEIFKFQDGGVGQRGTAMDQSAWGVDGSRIRYTTYVDRDSSIVGVDACHLWVYPENTTGTILAYQAVRQINYVRASNTAEVLFPITTGVFSVGGQNWMGAYNTYGLTIIGTGGGSASGVSGSMKYKVQGKTCFVDFTVGFNKNTLTGRVRIQLPYSSLNGGEIAIHAIMGAVGVKWSTQIGMAVLQGNTIEWLSGIGVAGDWSSYPTTCYANGSFSFEIV